MSAQVFHAVAKPHGRQGQVGKSVGGRCLHVPPVLWCVVYINPP